MAGLRPPFLRVLTGSRGSTLGPRLVLAPPLNPLFVACPYGASRKVNRMGRTWIRQSLSH